MHVCQYQSTRRQIRWGLLTYTEKPLNLLIMWTIQATYRASRKHPYWRETLCPPHCHQKVLSSLLAHPPCHVQSQLWGFGPGESIKCYFHFTAAWKCTAAHRSLRGRGKNKLCQYERQPGSSSQHMIERHKPPSGHGVRRDRDPDRTLQVGLTAHKYNLKTTIKAAAKNNS